MLHSYEAQLTGNQVTWLGAVPPRMTAPRRVVVVVEETRSTSQSQNKITGILRRANGVMGSGNRAEILAKIALSRDEWER